MIDDIWYIIYNVIVIYIYLCKLYYLFIYIWVFLTQKMLWIWPSNWHPHFHRSLEELWSDPACWTCCTASRLSKAMNLKCQRTSWKMLVNEKDYPIRYGKSKMFETTNQIMKPKASKNLDISWNQKKTKTWDISLKFTMNRGIFGPSGSFKTGPFPPSRFGTCHSSTARQLRQPFGKLWKHLARPRRWYKMYRETNKHWRILSNPYTV